MRKLIMALAVAALVSMTGGYSQANESRDSGAGGSTRSDSDSSYSTSGSGGSTEKSDKATSSQKGSNSGEATGSDTGKLITGWSAKKMIIDKAIYNEKDEKIGKVEDIIINQESSVSYAIIGVGGFLGVGEHQVAVPFNELKNKNNKFVMSGASKEELKQKPKFEYKKQK